MKRLEREGFTLVELLVVIAIIGVLVGLLLPAVQAAREAARRMSCQNNMKQLALSLHNHESSFKQYPSAGQGYSWCGSSDSYPGDEEIFNANGLVRLLPYIEQQNIYDQFNHDEAFAVGPEPRNEDGTMVGDPVTNGNAAVASTIIDTFICPSDPNPAIGRLSGSHYGPGTGFVGAATNYDFIVSDLDYSHCNYWDKAGVARRMFGENSTTRPADVTDGLSNTFALGETTKRHVNGAAFAWAYRTHVMTGVDPGTSWPGINLWHIPAAAPSWENPPYIPVRGHTRTWNAAAASLHPGGCGFAMADGSVAFISETIDTTLLERLCRMGDGEVISLP